MIINELDIELLLDLGHLVICVENMKIPLDSYLNDIPLNKISEIQISGSNIVDGILEIKAESAMLGYINAPSPFTNDGWFHTGDSVEQEGEYRTTTRFNVVELYVGVYRSRDRDTERALVDDLCAGITILEAEAPTAMLFAQITAHLQAVGRTVGDMDVLIAPMASSLTQPQMDRLKAHIDGGGATLSQVSLHIVHSFGPIDLILIISDASAHASLRRYLQHRCCPFQARVRDFLR